MDILFRMRGGLDLAFQLATPNGRSAQILCFFIIKLIKKYSEILTILHMKLRDRMNKLSKVI